MVNRILSILICIFGGLMISFGMVVLSIDSGDFGFGMIFIVPGAIILAGGIWCWKKCAPKHVAPIKKQPPAQKCESEEPVPLQVEEAPPSSTVIRTSPTAKNAYLFTADFIFQCRKKFIAIDLETTGLTPASDRILEIAAITYENFMAVDYFSTYVNPGFHIPSKITDINGINDDAVKDAPCEAEAIQKFCDHVGRSVLDGDVCLVAHNATFDIKFLLYALSRCGIEASIYFADTLYLSRTNLGDETKNHKLSTVAERLGVPQYTAHQAADDARVCAEIFIKLAEIQEKSIAEKCSALTDLEKSVGQWITKILTGQNLNVQLLSFDSGATYFSFKCFYTAIKFKLRGKKTYFLIWKGTQVPEGMESGPATKSEGENLKRVYFSTVADLEPFKEDFIQRYKTALEQAIGYIGDSTQKMQTVANQVNHEISFL